MKIALVNTYPQGGAGIACRRLQAALETEGAETALLYRDKAVSKWPFYAERLSFLPFEKDKSVRFSFSLANFGGDIRQHPDIQSADIIHLHWINQGFLSLRNIHQLASLGKPVFWTLHDMWAFTGGCHYTRGCTHFKQSCGHCPYLSRPAQNDLSYRIWLKKQQFFPKSIQFITCSNWLEQEARQSGLLRDFQIQTIPNPIDTTVFKPETEAQRDLLRQQLGIDPEAQVLLFVAMKIGETRKGFHYLLESLKGLKAQYPQRKYEVMVLGKAEDTALSQLPYPVHALGMVTDPAALAAWYSTADVFIIPSMEDNLPNTVMESLSCGTPVVGFNTGGIPEMVEDGKNGHIVPQGDSVGLMQAVAHITADAPMRLAMGHAARAKVVSQFSLGAVGKLHLAAYEAAR